MSKLAAAASVFAAALLAVPTNASACRCKGPPAGKRALKGADVAVRATVKKIHYDERLTHHPVALDLEVSAVFKGEAPQSFHVSVGRTSCAITWFEEGDEWLLFLPRDSRGDLNARQCRGSQRLRSAKGTLSKAAQRALKRVGPGAPPMRAP